MAKGELEKQEMMEQDMENQEQPTQETPTETPESTDYDDYLAELQGANPDADIANDADARHKAAGKHYKDTKAELDRHRKSNDDLNKLFGEVPEFAYYANDVMNMKDEPDSADKGKRMHVAFLRQFGTVFKDAMDDPSEENTNACAQAMQEWSEDIKASEAKQAEIESNQEQSKKNLEEWKQANNISDEQAEDIKDRLIEMVGNYLNGVIDSNMLDAVYKAGNYDNAVAEAENNGIATGRKEKVQEKLRTASGDGTPMIQGGGKAGTTPRDNFLSSATREDPWSKAKREKY